MKLFHPISTWAVSALSTRAPVTLVGTLGGEPQLLRFQRLAQVVPINHFTLLGSPASVTHNVAWHVCRRVMAKCGNVGVGLYVEAGIQCEIIK
eukprot:319014-Ditylum_brightwellii.AAC.1